ncbi:MAG: magnesium transporter [Polyangiaceae bacterium]
MLRPALAMLPEVRQILADDPAQLRPLLEEIHEEDLADLLTLLDDHEAGLVLRALPTADAAEVLERLDADAQEAMVAELGAVDIAPIVSEMSADERTDMLESLPAPVGDSLFESLGRVDPEAAAEVEQLARWPEDCAGGLMTTDYVSVGGDLTVAEVIARIRDVGGVAETIYYIYVLGDGGYLRGVASLRDLLLASSATSVLEVMTEQVHVVGPETDQKEVARVMAKYDFSALPVLDEHRRLLGVITVDDVMDVLTQEQDEDVQRMGAVEPLDASYFRTTFWTFIKKRGPWLLVLFVSEFFTGNALRHYDRIIVAVTTLSYYVPLLISTGGNSGSQSSSLIIRGLSVGDIKLGDWPRVLQRELGQGLVLGLCLATIGVLRVWMWGDGPRFMITIGVALVTIPILGCTVGSMLPLLLRRLGFDPATGSAPFIATLTDVLGIVIYFNVAQLAFAEVLAGATLH